MNGGYPQQILGKSFFPRCLYYIPLLLSGTPSPRDIFLHCHVCHYPINPSSRIMKKALADSKMSKDAKIAMQVRHISFIAVLIGGVINMSSTPFRGLLGDIRTLILSVLFQSALIIVPCVLLSPYFFRFFSSINQDCVAEFISFVTSEASDRLTLDKRRTITGDDVIDAIRALGFTAYVPELEQFLADCRKVSISYPYFVIYYLPRVYATKEPLYALSPSTPFVFHLFIIHIYSPLKYSFFLFFIFQSQKASKTTGDEAEFVPKKAREDT